MVRTAAVATATATVAAVVVMSSWGSPSGFVLPSGAAGAGAGVSSQRFSTPLPCVPVLSAEAESSAASSAPLGAIGALAVLSVLAARRALSRGRNASRTSSRVTMWMRKLNNPFKPAAKGQKPMINRACTRDIIKDNIEGYIRKHRTLDSMEDIVKKQLHGRMQFQFASEHFTDATPLMPEGGRVPRGKDSGNGHDMDNAFYVRKYLEPARFKKLSITGWEMPENFTKSVTLQELVAAGVQYGHKSSAWSPKMMKYLYADSDGSHIFDLVQTAAGLNRACYYVMEAAAKGATFLMVGTKEQARPIIRAAAERTGAHFCDLRYVGGLLTNFETVRTSIGLMFKLREDKAQGAWSVLSDDQKFRFQCKLNRLTKKYQGVEQMTSLPDLVIFIDEVKERHLINECTSRGIPTIGLIDSNSDPTFIDLPIPGNASGSRSIDLVISKLTDAIKVGQGLAAGKQLGDAQDAPKEWDPWVFSRDRLRTMRRRSKRQPWHKAIYGGYEQWKKANPFGYIPSMSPFTTDFQWQQPAL